MWFKLFVLVFIALAIITYGLFWLLKSFSSTTNYDFKEDFQKSFLSIHGSYAGFFNDNKPRRIIPILVIIGGIGILSLGIIKLF